MFDKIISVLTAGTIAFSSSVTDANIQEYKLPSNNYVQEAINDGESTAREISGESTVAMAIIDTGSTKTMRTTVETAHIPQELGTLTRMFIMIKAVTDDPKIIDETTDNDVISMVADYSKISTDDLWEKYGRSKLIDDLTKKYDLQETIKSDEWDKVQSTPVDIARLINRFLKDEKISNNQKNWVLALMNSTSTKLGEEDFTFGIPQARGVTNGKGGNKNISWMQGSPMSGDSLYKHSAAIMGDNSRYISVIMVKYPKNTPNEDANRVINEASKVTFSEESLEKSAPEEKTESSNSR